MRENLFETIKKIDKNGNEFWNARDLYKLLGYTEYGKFLPAIERAKESCKQSGQKIENHFAQASEMVTIGSDSKRKVNSFNLSRYACYLIAQNGDPRKVEIARAQTYFAIKTREREVEENLIEDNKRVYLRGQAKVHNKNLASTASRAGVHNFANFQDFGYMGLYGGLRQKEIKKKKGLSEKENLLDNVGSEELGANIFRMTQADAMIKRENIFGEQNANNAHNLVGKRVRETMKGLGATMPENLPKKDHIKNSKKRIKLRDKQQNKKMLD